MGYYFWVISNLLATVTQLPKDTLGLRVDAKENCRSLARDPYTQVTQVLDKILSKAFHLLKTMVYFPLLVSTGIFHWTCFFFPRGRFRK